MTNRLFRSEALQHLDEPDLGSMLQSAPGWPRPVAWLILIAAVATSVIAVRGSLPVYESGIGILRSDVDGLEAHVASCSIETLNPADLRASSRDSGSGSRAMYIAVMAGRQRPKLAPGMRVSLRLAGYPDAVVSARVESIGARLLAADDVRAVLRPLGADVSRIDGPVVSICGSLDTDRFQSGGGQYRFDDGMLADARVIVREERLVDRILPRAR